MTLAIKTLMQDGENAALEVGPILDAEDPSDLRASQWEPDEFSALWALAMSLA